MAEEDIHVLQLPSDIFPKMVTSIINKDTRKPSFSEIASTKTPVRSQSALSSRVHQGASEIFSPVFRSRLNVTPEENVDFLVELIENNRHYNKKRHRVLFYDQPGVIRMSTFTDRFSQLSIPSLSVPSHVISPDPIRKGSCGSNKPNVLHHRASTHVRQVCKNIPPKDEVYKQWRLKHALDCDKRPCVLNQVQVREQKMRQASIAAIKREDELGQNRRSTAKILIIGAGIAGLSAAHRLLSRKFKDITILEASNRIGGRIHSYDGDGRSENNDSSSSCPIELGVPGIQHCESWNTVYNLATKHKLIDDPVENKDYPPSDVHLFHHLGHNTSEWNRIRATAYCKTMDSASGAAKIINELCGKPVVNLSYKDYTREQTKRLLKHRLNLANVTSPEQELRDLTLQISSFIKHRMYRLGDNNGNSAVQYFSERAKDNSVITRIPRGMSSLLNPLTSLFKRKTIRFNSKVKTIDFTSCLESRLQTEDYVKVTCHNGTVFTAKHVIITLPLGYLKKHARCIFSPPLSESKMKAIDRLGFGSVSKILLQYSTPCWSQNFKFIWTDDIGVVPENMSSKDVLIFSSLADKPVVEVACPDTYLDDVCDMYLKKLTAAVLASYLQKYVPEAEKIIRGNWSVNPLFCGTHPYRSQSSNPNDVKELALPVYAKDTPILMFAGDATHESYDNLMHGARASGLREARRLEHFYDELYKYKNER